MNLITVTFHVHGDLTGKLVASTVVFSDADGTSLLTMQGQFSMRLVKVPVGAWLEVGDLALRSDGAFTLDPYAEPLGGAVHLGTQLLPERVQGLVMELTRIGMAASAASSAGPAAPNKDAS